MSHAIQAEGLVKHFGDTKALDGVDLEVPFGQVVGVLGPNGAGKTTAVRILATLMKPDAGRATVGGFDVVTDPVRVRSLIGLTGQYASVDEDLNGIENLMLIGRLLRPAPRPGQDAGRRADRPVRADRRGQAPDPDVLGRHAAPDRPGRQPRRRPRGALPRRADHRARPARPQRGLGGRPRPRRRGRDGAADHAVPRRGRPAGRQDHRVRPRPRRRRRPGRRAEAPGRRADAAGPADAAVRHGRRQPDPRRPHRRPARAATTPPACSPRRSTTRCCCPPWSASSTKPGSPRTSWRCGCPASTRCSSP